MSDQYLEPAIGDEVITKYGVVGILYRVTGHKAVILTPGAEFKDVPVEDVYKQAELDVDNA